MKLRIFRISLISGLILLSFILSTMTVQADIDEIGIRPGDRFEWTLSSVDEEVFEDLKGYYRSYWRNDKKMVFEIENIEENKDDNYWSVEYEFWSFLKEDDDDGTDGDSELYIDTIEFTDALDDFFDGKCSPGSLPFRAIFIPIDVEDLLDVAANDIWPISAYEGTLDASKNEIEWGYQYINATMSYTDDGVLEKIEVEFKKDTAYILDLTGIGAKAISYGFYFIPIFAGSVIIIILVLRRKINLKP